MSVETFSFLVLIMFILLVIGVAGICVELYIKYREHEYHKKVIDKVINKL